MTVLVVDDEPTTPRLYDQRFRKEIRQGQLKILYATTAEAALTLVVVDHAEVDLILSDINMPGMSGIEFLEALKIRGCLTPVYMVSAYDGSDYERQALEKGAKGFLAKPLRFEELTRLLAEIPSKET